MNALPIVIFWALAIWGLTSRRPVLIYLFFGSMAFGSFAVIPPEMTAGLSFTPTPIIAVLIMARTLVNNRGIAFALTSALFPNRFLLLFLFWLVAVFTTLFMPRLFAGSVEVIPMRGVLTDPGQLYPSIQNISHLTYFTISVFSVFAFARLLQKPRVRQAALKAMCLGGAVIVVTGMLDLASQYLPLAPLLEPFRTASYALLTDNEVLGAKRVVGLTPEASAYGGLCVTFLSSTYFLRSAIADRTLRTRIVPVLLLFLALFASLSTSSSAYVGLALFAMLAGLEWLWRAVALKQNSLRRRGLKVEFLLVFAAIVGVLLIALIKPSLFDPIVAMVDQMVFKKTDSQSFEQRSMWTEVSLKALFDTYGLGVGMGGTRASNAVVAVFSNLGLLGGLLYYFFVVQSLMRKARRDDIEGATLISGFRWSYWATFILGLLAGTTADFGTMLSFYFGTAAALSVIRSGSSSPAPNASHARYQCGVQGRTSSTEYDLNPAVIRGASK